MEFRAIQKFIRISPKKIRPVAAAIKKLRPLEAVEKLPFVAKRANVPLKKVIVQALASAKEKGISGEDLQFKEIQINEGPRLKRGRPVSRGRWHPIKKQTSHIRVVLETKTTNEKLKVQNAKLDSKKQERKKSKSRVKNQK